MIKYLFIVRGRNEEALSSKWSIERGPRFTSSHRAKATAVIFLNREKRQEAAEMSMAVDPSFSIPTRPPRYRNPDFQKKYITLCFSPPAPPLDHGRQP